MSGGSIQRERETAAVSGDDEQFEQFKITLRRQDRTFRLTTEKHKIMDTQRTCQPLQDIQQVQVPYTLNSRPYYNISYDTLQRKTAKQNAWTYNGE